MLHQYHRRAYQIIEMYERAYVIPLPRSHKVLAHIAGPSGSGKTEIATELSKTIHNVIFKDLDEFDDEAIAQLKWAHIPKNDYTDLMLRQLHQSRQHLLDQYIARSPHPIIFVGHHIESGHVLRIPTAVRILLNVNPRTAALRRYKRYSYDRARLKHDIEIGREDVQTLRSHGYIALSPRQIYSTVTKWSQQLDGSGEKRGDKAHVT